MRRRVTLTTGSGIFAIFAFLALGAASYARYPTAFSVTANWLSDLGNQILNPRGAGLFQFDVILVGVLVGLFYVGLTVWHKRQPTRMRVFVSLSQFFGLASGVAMAMTGVFSEGLHASHAIWAGIFFISSGAAVFLSGLAFLHYHKPFKRLTCLAFSLAVLEWVLAGVSKVHVLEWVVVALLLVYFGSVAVGTSAVARRQRVAA